MRDPARTQGNHRRRAGLVGAAALGALVLGGPTLDKVLAALAWTVGITVVFAALSVRRYRQAA